MITEEDRLLLISALEGGTRSLEEWNVWAEDKSQEQLSRVIELLTMFGNGRSEFLNYL